MRVLIAAAIGFWMAAPVSAECPDASYGTGAVRALDVAKNKADADVIISMSMMPKLMHIDYRAEASRKPACKLAEFEVGSSKYELRADDTAGGTRRVALPDQKGAPVAELIPVTNIMEAIEASKQGKTASVSGYMLATVSKNDFTGWRLYTGVPNQATLAADMVAALGGTMRPIFRNDGRSGKTDLFVTQ